MTDYLHMNSDTMSKYVTQTLTSLTVSRVVCGPHLVVISIILGVLLLQQLSLSPLLLQGLLDERGHLALLARTLSANHKPATARVVRDIPGNTHTHTQSQLSTLKLPLHVVAAALTQPLHFMTQSSYCEYSC